MANKIVVEWWLRCWIATRLAWVQFPVSAKIRENFLRNVIQSFRCRKVDMLVFLLIIWKYPPQRIRGVKFGDLAGQWMGNNSSKYFLTMFSIMLFLQIIAQYQYFCLLIQSLKPNVVSPEKTIFLINTGLLVYRFNIIS